MKPPADTSRPGWFSRWRLATRLTVAVVALALPLELLVIGSAINGVLERRNAELDNAVLVGQALAAVVDGFAGDLQSTLLATSLALGSQPTLDQETAGPNLQTLAAQYPALRAMFLTDTDGRLIATGTGGALGFDLSTRPYIVALKGGAETTWSGGIAGIQTGETTVAFGRVVRGTDGAPHAFLVAAFYPQQLAESLPVSLPPDSRVTLLDDDGTVIYHSNPSEQAVGGSTSADVQAALAGRLVRLVGEAAPIPGQARFGALVPLPRLHWVVAYTRPRAAVEAAVATRSLVQAGGTVLVIVAAAGVMILMARRLTRPLTTLSETAEAVARGERPTIPALHTDWELEQLASAMRLMSTAVADREVDLISQREWLRVTLASIGDAVIATDAEGRVAFLNGPAVELTGWPETEALGQSIDTVLNLRNEITREAADSPIQCVLREGMVVGLANHTLLVARDGSERPIDDSAAPIRDTEGNLIGVVMVFRDVSERRRAEEALRESQRHLELALQAARMVAWEWDPATNEVTTSSNLGDVYGLAEIESAEQAFAMIHEDDRAGHIGKIQDTLAHGGSYRSEFRVVRPDTGQVVWREEYGVAITDQEGQVRKIAGVVIDVTQQREAEAALRESDTRFRLAVDASPVILFTHDTDLRYTWVSRAFPGLSPEAILGRTDAEIFPLEIAAPIVEVKRRALEADTRVEQEVRLTVGGAAGSAQRSWMLTIEPLRDAAGHAQGVTCAAVDVTEQRALERLQQEFISMVSHELRNPLASIKGYAQLLDRRRAYSERAVEAILQQSDRLDRLISDLLDSSRLQAGRLELRRARVDLLDVAAAAVERALTQTSEHEIRLEASSDPILGFWDAERLDQVFNNLLSNAMKYSPDGGEIVVRVLKTGGEASVAIRDHGMGIEPDQLARLFDRFYRAQQTAQRAQGLGVGLYIARELVEAHGGRISARSDGSGHGSTFLFTLPLADPATREVDAPAPVLVVDDDPLLRELITEALLGEGYRVATAGDGSEAMDEVEAEEPSLILLDWMMPRMDGGAFVTELRRRQPDTAIPILVMTAGGEARERAASIRADGFIRKPFELALLLDQVARYVKLSDGSAAPAD